MGKKRRERERLRAVEERGAADPSESYPDIDAQLYARQRAQVGGLTPTVREAMGIPAVNRAVTMLATTAGSLDLNAYRGGSRIEPDPPLIRRPCRTMRAGQFTRDTVHAMASYGEAIWLTMERYAEDGAPASVMPIPPVSVKSDWNGIEHRWYRMGADGKAAYYDPRDVTHITLLVDPATGRGLGPMQLCGAALNVAVEADRWASRYFAGGGMPSIFLNATGIINGADADKIKEDWLADPPNTPKVASNIEPHILNSNPEQGQLLDSRAHSRGDVALMFGINGRLLEAPVGGTALSYTNVGDLATELVRLTLAPYYLEQIEQAFSDLLARGTEARYDVEGFQRADPLTRWRIYELAQRLGVLSAEQIADKELIELDGNAEPPPMPTPVALPPPTPIREVG
jgi:HK97 family phage portal protein